MLIKMEIETIDDLKSIKITYDAIFKNYRPFTAKMKREIDNNEIVFRVFNYKLSNTFLKSFNFHRILYFNLMNIIPIYFEYKSEYCKFFGNENRYNIIFIEGERIGFSDPEFIRNKLKNNNYKWIFFTVCHIISPVLYHMNVLFYDVSEKTLEHFEPHGHSAQYTIPKTIIKVIENVKLPVKNYRSSVEACPYLGLQYGEDPRELTDELDINQKSGYCEFWSYLFIELKITNPNIETKTLQIKFLEFLTEIGMNKLDYVREYFLYIHNLFYKVVTVLVQIPRYCEYNMTQICSDKKLIKWIFNEKIFNNPIIINEIIQSRENILKFFEEFKKKVNFKGPGYTVNIDNNKYIITIPNYPYEKYKDTRVSNTFEQLLFLNEFLDKYYLSEFIEYNMSSDKSKNIVLPLVKRR